MLHLLILPRSLRGCYPGLIECYILNTTVVWNSHSLLTKKVHSFGVAGCESMWPTILACEYLHSLMGWPRRENHP